MCNCDVFALFTGFLLLILKHTAWHILYLSISLTTLGIYSYVQEKRWFNRIENQRLLYNSRLEAIQRVRDVIEIQERIYGRGEESKEWFLQSINELSAESRGASSDKGNCLKRLRMLGEEDHNLRAAGFLEFV
ncbi:hypothetical protein B0J14DRAFT_45328 [Halenospora varia]|nr:hypothetical protein B0J14DRAFT_45328 [Halenospora varia]